MQVYSHGHMKRILMEVAQALVTPRTGVLGGAGILARGDLAWLAGKLDVFSVKAGLCVVLLTNKLTSKSSDAGLCFFSQLK